MIDFDALIDRYLTEERRPKQIGRYYPSEAGMCLRQVWYTYTQPKETDTGLTRIFHMGTMLHEFAEKVLGSENPTLQLVASEQPFKIQEDGFTVSGRVDDIVLLKERNEKALVEVKSCRSVERMAEPQNSHKMQLQLYMHATGVPSGMLLYIEKNTLKSKTFSVAYDADWAQRIMQRFGLLHRHLKDGVLPPAEGKRLREMSVMCANCDYAEECGRDGDEAPSNGHATSQNGQANVTEEPRGAARIASSKAGRSIADFVASAAA